MICGQDCPKGLVRVPTAYGSYCDQKPVPSGKSAKIELHNQDVLDLLHAGLDAEIIKAKVRSSPSDFDISVSALKELKAENVPQDVILAMVQASAATDQNTTPAAIPVTPTPTPEPTEKTRVSTT